MKLNNKGMTLMELLISIVLIGIVLTFLFQLLTDLRNETDNNNYAYNNQVNRTEVIYTIEKDLQKYTLLGIEDGSSNNKLVIKFHYLKGSNDRTTAILETDTYEYTDELGDSKTKYYLRYTNYKGEITSWEMKGAEIDSCGSFSFYTDASTDSYYFKLNIYLYNNPLHERNYQDKNNAVDDIEITYADHKSDLITTNGSYLTYSNGDKNIGICTN